jgi:hypothetical protein
MFKGRLFHNDAGANGLSPFESVWVRLSQTVKFSTWCPKASIPHTTFGLPVVYHPSDIRLDGPSNLCTVWVRLSQTVNFSTGCPYASISHSLSLHLGYLWYALFTIWHPVRRMVKLKWPFDSGREYWTTLVTTMNQILHAYLNYDPVQISIFDWISKPLMRSNMVCEIKPDLINASFDSLKRIMKCNEIPIMKLIFGSW